MRLFATWLACSLAAGAAASPIFAPDVRPGTAQEGETLFIKAGRLIVKPGEVLDNAQVIVRGGLIIEVGTGLAKPEGAREIEAAVVCAGFIDPWSTLGVDAASVRDDRTGIATRTVDAIDVFSNDRLRLETLRSGVTSVRTQAGDKSKFGGIGAIVHVAPGTSREAVVVLADANVAASVGLSRGGRKMDVFDRVSEIDKLISEIESGRKYEEDLTEYEHELTEWKVEVAEKEAKLEKDFKKAKKSRTKKVEEAEEKGKEFKEKKYKDVKKPKPPKFDLDKEIMARVARGELPLVVQAHRAGEIRELLDLTEPFDRLRLVITGGTEAVAFAEELAERRIPVIVWPAPLGTTRADELSGHDLGLAGRLADAGVRVLIGSGGSSASRDLPLLAGVAIGHGLDRAAAFEALTLGAARTFDVADRIGSVERGKLADLIGLDGPPLVSTSRVRYVIVGGEVVLTPEN